MPNMVARQSRDPQPRARPDKCHDQESYALERNGCRLGCAHFARAQEVKLVRPCDSLQPARKTPRPNSYGNCGLSSRRFALWVSPPADHRLDASEHGSHGHGSQREDRERAPDGPKPMSRGAGASRHAASLQLHCRHPEQDRPWQRATPTHVLLLCRCEPAGTRSAWGGRVCNKPENGVGAGEVKVGRTRNGGREARCTRHSLVALPHGAALSSSRFAVHFGNLGLALNPYLL